MTAIDAGDAPVLAGMRPPPRKARFLPGRRASDNPFDSIPLAAYEQPVWRQPSPFMRAYLVNDPAGLRQVLIDKVANYPKTPLERRAFKALFGDGLLSSDGETWRAHRRIMAPSFDPRSVATYAQAMAGASEAFASRWHNLPDGAEKDISAEMTALTLEIISRTVFSGDAGEMTAIAGEALHDSAEAAFNFGLLDILPIIGPIRLADKVKLMGQIFAPMDGAIERLIEARRADPGKTDLLGRLVAALDE